MMLVMFAVGTMNVVWMAALGVLMTDREAVDHRAIQSRGRCGFVAIGSVMVVWSVCVGWRDGLEPTIARVGPLDDQGRADAVV